VRKKKNGGGKKVLENKPRNTTEKITETGQGIEEGGEVAQIGKNWLEQLRRSEAKDQTEVQRV